MRPDRIIVGEVRGLTRYITEATTLGRRSPVPGLGEPNVPGMPVP